MNKNIIWAIIAAVIVIVLVFWLWPEEKEAEAPVIEETDSSTYVNVAPSTDVLENVTPENPLEKTNPFR